MAHQHANHHHSPEPLKEVKKAFLFSIGLNLGFVIVEFVMGFYSHSLALFSDAGHNLSDVASLSLSLLAFKLSKHPANTRFTYGLSKSTVLASLANAILLLIIVGSIGLEAIDRFRNPVAVKGGYITLVASIGIVLNTLSALLFRKHKEKDLNLKGAYLHLLMDAFVSVAVVLAGIFITYTGYTWIDPLISILVMVVIILSTWKLLTESLKLSLDAVPYSIDLAQVKAQVLKISGIKDIHHIHIWALSTTQNALTAHLLLEGGLEEQQIHEIKQKVKHTLDHLNIHHCTLETETINCSEKDCM